MQYSKGSQQNKWRDSTEKKEERIDAKMIKVSKGTLVKWKHYVKTPNGKTGSLDKGDWKWMLTEPSV